MLLWLIIAVMLAATLAALLLPLYKGRDTLATREAYDANIYKDQLRAVDRELAEGLIEDDEAEAARIEISRKLLATAEKAKKKPAIKATGRELSRKATLFLALAIPLAAVGTYVKFGSPELKDQPLYARSDPAMEKKQQVARLIARAEKRLSEHPEDGRGWEIMAPVFMQHNMFEKAANAYQMAVKLLGPSSERLTGLADARVMGNKGIVSDDVLPILKRAIKADKNNPKARFWMGLYQEQNNHLIKAEEIYTVLLKKSPSDVPWRPTVQSRLDKVRKKRALPPLTIAGIKQLPTPKIKLGDALGRELDKKKNPHKSAGKAKTGEKSIASPRPELLKGPSAADMKRAGKMSAQDRQTMISNMVERLSERLHDEGGDVKSWMRLVNVYMVLGRRQEAVKAVHDARKNLGKKQSDVDRVEALATKLGLPF